LNKEHNPFWEIVVLMAAKGGIIKARRSLRNSDQYYENSWESFVLHIVDGALGGAQENINYRISHLLKNT